MKNYIWKLFTNFVERISRTHTFHAHFSLLFTIWAMALATGISSIYHHVNPTGSANVALIYILTIIIISYHTDISSLTHLASSALLCPDIPSPLWSCTSFLF